MAATWVERIFGSERASDSLSAPLQPAAQTVSEESLSYLGIELPQDLVQQLKMISSTPLEWLNDWEIKAAAVAYADGVLVEDEHGEGLIDKLTLDMSEQSGIAADIGGYAHNFEPSSITWQLIDAGSKAVESIPEYLANFSFVERYLSEIGSNALSLI